ncbi:hypothetical protein RB195_006436 [Necator americanus]|uniref:Uncharacterized protein n=1 Tax=Necator americanus TaxID=51031 RepID=A0ABR1BSL8_NECAM
MLVSFKLENLQQKLEKSPSIRRCIIACEAWHRELPVDTERPKYVNKVPVVKANVMQSSCQRFHARSILMAHLGCAMAEF